MSKITLLLFVLLTFNTIRYSVYLTQGSESVYHLVMLGSNIAGLIIGAIYTYSKTRSTA
ncbi:hypothetical protein [Jeotgalibacillus malaysiensis]|uniref:hypothetical protein n=1 Tax=Jeotgalibacillus malaysiensis TaxID=1508404 RepID=UPI00384E8155